MRYYETLYIIHPDYEDERLSKVQNEVDARVKREGGSIINSYVWGKRHLAYPVNKRHYGTYMMLHYEAKEPMVFKLNSWMELKSELLAYITLKLDEKPALHETNGESVESAKSVRDKDS